MLFNIKWFFIYMAEIMCWRNIALENLGTFWKFVLYADYFQLRNSNDKLEEIPNYATF
jgi:hypothetical protein